MRTIVKPKLKIAVQLFGHLRTYKECYEDFKKNLLDKYDCDVFMHTWDTTNHSTKTWHENTMENIKLTPELINEIKNLYMLKDMIIEHQESKDMGNLISVGQTISVYGIHCMFHSMAEVNKLREKYEKITGVNYDFVVMLRPDIILYKDFSIEKYIDRLSKNDINYGFFTYSTPYMIINELKHLGSSDVLFFAKPKIISNVFHNIDKVVEKIKTDITIDSGPEYYFIELIESLGYKIKLIKYGNNDDCILKRTQKIKKKKILRLKISLNEVYLYLFPNLKFNIINLCFSMFDSFKFSFFIGKLYDK